MSPALLSLCVPLLFLLLSLFSILIVLPHILCPSNAPPFTMSVVASSRPDTAAVPYGSMPQDAHVPHYHPTSPYVAPARSVSSRFSSTSSINSINTTFSVSSAPASFSPISPTPPFLPYSTASRLPHTAESPFRRLPPNVYASILNHLEYLHTGPRQAGCITCFQRDLHSLSLTCRSWEKAVRAKL